MNTITTPKERSTPLLETEHFGRTRKSTFIDNNGGTTTSNDNVTASKPLTMFPLKSSLPLTFLKWILVLLSGGLFGLLLLWNIRIRYWFMRNCTQVEAEVFLIYSDSKCQWIVSNVGISHGITYFECEGNRYYWDGNKYTHYIQQITWTHHEIVNTTTGATQEQLSDYSLAQVGPNVIDIPVTPLIEDILFAFFGPVQVYQYFCCAVWYVHGYPAFATLLMVSLLVSTSLVIYNNRKSRERLREMAMLSVEIQVLRQGKWQVVSSTDLIPGDLVKLPKEEFKCPCDLVLVSGTVLVDESFLTGESLPVVKTQPEDDKSIRFDPEKDKRHCIYNSTTILSSTPGSSIEHSDEVVGLVARTGYRTSKGQLMKAILHSKPYPYHYLQQSFYFLLILLVMGIILFFVTLYIWGVFDPNKGLQTKEQILYAFESIVCLVPPFLPIIFDITLLLSARNLASKTVYTTNPSRISISGKVKIMCFDKTGTLTKTDLDVIGVVPRDMGEVVDPVPVKYLDEEDQLLQAMAVCHSLSSIGNIIELEDDILQKQSYSGPKLDVQMFESTGWRYDQGHPGVYPFSISPNQKQIDILKRFDFDHNLQRMSVLARINNENAGEEAKGECVIFVKGSGESIKACCNPETIPDNFDEILKRYSRDGCYVIGLASRPFPLVSKQELLDLVRTDIENNLNFLGLLLLRNELRSDSNEAIFHIKQGRIRTVMVTGDNLFTAFYIAKKCGIIYSQDNDCFCGTFDENEGRVVFREFSSPHKTLDPYNWKVTHENGTVENVDPTKVNIGIDHRAYEELLAKGNNDLLVKRTQIFARMRPLQKQELVDLMIEQEEIVGMCGDGANDCAALSHAHFGVALSATEASLIAPFTAQSLSTVSCVDLIKEGRACLTNSFSAFKLTLFHAIVINTTAMFISFTFGADLSQGEYLVTDFIFYFLPLFFIVRSKPADLLEGNPPTSKIFGPTTLFSFLSMVVASWIAEGVSIALLKNQVWFVPHTAGYIAKYDVPETTVVFLVCVFLLGACGVAVSFGATWRQPIWMNYPLLVTWIIQIGTIVFVYIVPHLHTHSGMKMAWLMDMVQLPVNFRIQIALVGGSIAVLIILWEKLVIIGPVASFFRKKTGRGRPPPSFNPIWNQ